MPLKKRRERASTVRVLHLSMQRQIFLHLRSPQADRSLSSISLSLSQIFVWKESDANDAGTLPELEAESISQTEPISPLPSLLPSSTNHHVLPYVVCESGPQNAHSCRCECRFDLCT